MTDYSSTIVESILTAIQNLNTGRFIIGIDGPSASGKSTLANELIGYLNNTEIICMDNFYKPGELRNEADRINEIGSYFDWRRLEKQVLIPFKNNLDIVYDNYDWMTDRISGSKHISRKHNIIVEGVYSIRKELANYYNYKIWIDCPYETRLQRGIIRDGIEMKDYWETVWMKQENEYMAAHKSSSYADFIIDQAASL